MLLFLFLVAGFCYEDGPIIFILTKQSYDKVIIKRDNKIIGNLYPDGQIREIRPYRIYGKIANNIIDVQFKTSLINNSGSYDFYLDEQFIDNWVYRGWTKSPPRRLYGINITQDQDNYFCNVIEDDILWHVVFDKPVLIHTLNSTLSKSLVCGFTKIYCERFYAPTASDILYANGRIKKLTWASDYN